MPESEPKEALSPLIEKINPKDCTEKPLSDAALKKGTSIDLKVPIDSLNFDLDYVVKNLDKTGGQQWTSLRENQEIVGADVKQISGIGFLSHIFRIQFHFKDVEEPFSVILKVPTTLHIPAVNTLADDEFLKSFAVKLSERHNQEIFCYEHFGPKIRKVVHIAQIFSTCKATNAAGLENACILMEDLGGSGAHPSVMQGMNEQQVESLIKCIAEIHAISLSIPNSQEVLGQLKWNCTLDQEDGQTKNSVVENLLKLPVDYFQRNKEALLKMASQNDIMIFDVHKHFNTPAVLCHGDFWANNIIFRYKDKTKQEIGSEVYALLDWQFAHPSTGLIDVLRCILIGVNASIKIRCLESWIELYFKSFGAGCRKFGVKNPYTLELVKKMFHFQYASEMIFSFMIILNHYALVADEGIKTALLGRMISSFETIRKNYE